MMGQGVSSAPIHDRINTRQQQALLHLPREGPWETQAIARLARMAETQGPGAISGATRHLEDLFELIGCGLLSSIWMQPIGPSGVRRTYLSVELPDGRRKTAGWTVSGWHQYLARLDHEVRHMACGCCGHRTVYRPDAPMRCSRCGAMGLTSERGLYQAIVASIEDPKDAWAHLKAFRGGAVVPGAAETWWYRGTSDTDRAQVPALDQIAGADPSASALSLPIRIDPYGKLPEVTRDALLSEADPKRLSQRVRSLGRGASAMLIPKCDNCRYCVGLASSRWREEARWARHCAWPVPAATLSLLRPDMRLDGAAFEFQCDLTAKAAQNLVNLDGAAHQPGALMTCPGEMLLAPVCGRYTPTERDWQGRPISGVVHPSVTMELEAGQPVINQDWLHHRPVSACTISPDEAFERIFEKAVDIEDADQVIGKKITMRNRKGREILLHLLEAALPVEWRLQEDLADMLDRYGLFDATDKALLWLIDELVAGARRELATTGRVPREDASATI